MSATTPESSTAGVDGHVPHQPPFLIQDGGCLCRAHRREICSTCGTDYAALNVLAKCIRQSGRWPIPANPETAARAAKLKEQGNGCFKKGEWEVAAKFYTVALDLARNRPIWEPTQLAREELSVNLNNRAAAYLELGRFHEARADAFVVTQLRGDWSKAHYRLGRALEALGMLPEAEVAYDRGFTLEPTSAQMKESLHALRKQIRK